LIKLLITVVRKVRTCCSGLHAWPICAQVYKWWIWTCT